MNKLGVLRDVLEGILDMAVGSFPGCTGESVGMGPEEQIWCPVMLS